MSPTINTSSLKGSESQMYENLSPHNRKNSDSGSDTSESSFSNSEPNSGNAFLSAASRNNSAGYALVNNGLVGVSSQLKSSHAATGGKFSLAHELSDRRGGINERLGVARLTHLPVISTQSGNKSSRFNLGRESATNNEATSWKHIRLERESRNRKLQREQERPAFPASASVSIPNSTTAVNYLVHEHDSFGIKDKNVLSAPTSYSGDGLIPITSSAIAVPLSLRNQSASSVIFNEGSSDYLQRYYANNADVPTSEGNVSSSNSKTTSFPISMTTKNAPRSKMGTDKTSSSSEPKAPNKNHNSKCETGGSGDQSRKQSDSSSNNRRSRIDSKSAGFQFFYVEPCLYTHRMFVRAAKIFDVLKSEDSETQEAKASRRRRGEADDRGNKIPDMDFRNAHEQIKTFELTFATLKYQDLFRDILERTGFFHEFNNLRSDYSLVCIILFDLQSRKFQRRIPLPEELRATDDSPELSIVPPRVAPNSLTDDTLDGTADSEENTLFGENVAGLDTNKYVLDDACLEIENALLSRKTRFQSSIAKERIRRNAPSLEYLLPEQVRNKDETKSSTPVFCWVNQMKAKKEKVIESLLEDGFEELHNNVDIAEYTTKVFRRDFHCSDLLVFPPYLNLYFKDSLWVKNGELVQQDKSSCLAPETIQFLLGIDQDVIHVNVGTGMTTGHVASLIRQRSPHTHIWAFGNNDIDRLKKAARNIEFLGMKNTKIVQESFLNVDPEDSRYKNVRVILITANCSKSAITSPVQFIVSEGEDMQILGELSQADSNMARIKELTIEHEASLRHALKFPRVRAVVYTTRSRYQAENEQVVTRVLEAVNAGAQNNKKVLFKVTPPVLPFASDEIGSSTGIVDGRFACFRPTEKANGCFIAIITREPDDPKEIAKSAIARARSKGMLGSKGDTKFGDENSPVASKGKTRGGRSRKSAGDAATSAPATKSTGGAAAGSGGNTLKHKLTTHRSASVGARLYQTGVVSRLEQHAKLRPHRPEHVKVVKHPAPFSKRQREVAI